MTLQQGVDAMAYVTFDQLAAEPGLLSGDVRNAEGLLFSVRLLRPGDGPPLGQYFEELSAAVRRVYGPHPLTAAHADVLCADLDYRLLLPFLAWTDGGDVAAYVVVHVGVRDGDRKRFIDHGQALADGECATIAPCVADRWQGRGVGSAVLAHVAGAMRRLKRRRLVLWGGVRGDNPKAQHVYRKLGFRRVGNFTADGVDNFDMDCNL